MNTSLRNVMDAARIMEQYRPGSCDAPWDWMDEAADIALRECACCGKAGHHQEKIEQSIAAEGFREPVLLGDDGRVWDGHHRILAGRRLRLLVPVEYGETRNDVGGGV